MGRWGQLVNKIAYVNYLPMSSSIANNPIEDSSFFVHFWLTPYNTSDYWFFLHFWPM